MQKFSYNSFRVIIEKSVKDILDIIVTTYHEWVDDKAFTMAAALSFYSLISLAPFLMIITAAAGFVFEQKAVTGQIVTGIDEYVGPSVAKMIQSLILNANVPGSGDSCCFDRFYCFHLGITCRFC